MKNEIQPIELSMAPQMQAYIDLYNYFNDKLMEEVYQKLGIDARREVGVIPSTM